jgi:hypothetical protein
MNATTLGLLGLVGLFAAQSAAPPTLVEPAVPDVAIKTRRTFDHKNSSIATTIVYLKGARQRREDIVDWPPQVSAKTGSKRAHIQTTITQCDERRTAMLNDDVKTYVYTPIDPSFYLRWARLAASRPPQPEPTGGDVTITIDAVDTGERRTMGRYVARHVMTTTRTESGPGTTTPSGENSQDGWYIDLPPANCWDWGDLPEPFVFTSLQRADAPEDRLHIVRRGTARRGYPIEEITRSQNERGTPTSKIELIEFSDAPLDAALFTVPAEYRPALPDLFGGYDLTKPDTVMNRLHSYWDGVRAWADGRLRLAWWQ